MVKWTRERIIREILQREAAGLSLLPGAENGVDSALYQAGSRIFGNWQNAVRAAGITPERAKLRSFWTPARVVGMLKYYARSKQSRRNKSFKLTHARLIAAATRLFGTWSKALEASGVDAVRFQRVPRWTEATVIEAILKRALTNAPLGTQSTQPRSLVTAGKKFFGSWSAALVKAGLAPEKHMRIVLPCPPTEVRSAPSGVGSAGHGPPWSNETVIQAVRERFRAGLKMSSAVVYAEYRPLQTAGVRRFGNWRNTILAAGLDPDTVCCRRGRPPKGDSIGASPVSKAETQHEMRPQALTPTPVLSEGL